MPLGLRPAQQQDLGEIREADPAGSDDGERPMKRLEWLFHVFVFACNAAGLSRCSFAQATI
jgi:hypothetical protein